MESKYDWNALKTEYVTGEISKAALAEKHGINRTTLYRHAQIERWNEAKKEHLDNIASKCADNAAYIAAVKLAKELDIANKLGDVLDDAAADSEQFRRYIVTEKCEGGTTQTEERVFDKVDMRALNDAIKALRSLEEIKSIMYGIVSPAEERRLALREKSLSDESGGETGVVMLPEIESTDEK